MFILKIKIIIVKKVIKLLEDHKEKCITIVNSLITMITPNSDFSCTCEPNEMKVFEEKIADYKSIIEEINGAIHKLNEPSIREYHYAFDMAEDNLMSTDNGWIDESCGNFTGWCKDYPEHNHTLSVWRTDTAIGGKYYFSKSKLGYRATDSCELDPNILTVSFNKLRDLISRSEPFVI